jgi:hypothetical protein
MVSLNDNLIKKWSKYWTNLLSLDLNLDCGYSEDLNKLVTDGSLEYIACHCEQLTTLNLSNASSITDYGIMCIAEGCKNMIKLDLKACTGLTDKAIEVLANNCHKLEYLDISQSESYSDLALCCLAGNCPQLQVLLLSDCPITDNGLIALVLSCQFLKELYIPGCPYITNESIYSIAKNCRYLKFITLSQSLRGNLMNVTDSALEILQHSCQNIKINVIVYI